MTDLTDFSQAFLFDDFDVRGELVSLNAITKTVIAAHNYPPVVANLLGELLASCALLRSMLQFDGALLLQARSEGAIKLLLAEYQSSGTMRGVARFATDLAFSPNFNDLLQKGVLVLTVEPKNGQRYQGIIALDQADLAACLAQYFAQSQQLETFFLLSFHNNCARGLLLQQLPAQLESDEQRVQNFQHLKMLSLTLTAAELHSLTNEQILRRLFHQEKVRIFAPQSLRFACSCSREKSLNALSSLNNDEIKQLLAAQNGIISVRCEFCNTAQFFKESDLNLMQIH